MRFSLFMLTVAALALGLVLSGCANQSPATTQTVHLLYMGNLDGELEPCGCTEEGDLGGILRQTTMIDQLRNRHPNLFMIHSGGLFNSTIATDQITSSFIVSGLKAQSFDAIGLQWKDLSYGIEFIASSGLPIVASNWPDETFSSEQRVERPGARLAFFQWLDADQSPYREMKGDHFLVTRDTDKLAKALSKARSEDALTILATTLPRAEADARLPVQLADIVILQSKYEEYGAPDLTEGRLYLQPGSRGQRLGIVELKRTPSGRIADARQEVINLPNRVADAERLKKWYAEFTEALRADYKERVKTRKARASEPSPYTGDAACAACHAEAYKAWKGSRHARAFSTLERVNKAFDANCLECHTVAFNQPGGFIDPQITPDRLNVQCEVCHGPGQRHIETSGAEALDKPLGPDGPVCLQCHNRSHSPLFNFDQYWPKIQHGLDQQGAAR